jgi:hypothetical protein
VDVIRRRTNYKEMSRFTQLFFRKYIFSMVINLKKVFLASNLVNTSNDILVGKASSFAFGPAEYFAIIAI